MGIIHLNKLVTSPNRVIVWQASLITGRKVYSSATPTPLLRPLCTVIDGSSTLNISLSLFLAARMSLPQTVSRPAASRQLVKNFLTLIGGHTVAVW